MRAFIFSLDAFVAFTLALVAIYTLIFFSSVPSAYYFLLTQGHYLSRDVLLSLSTTHCSDDYGECKATGTLLDNIVAQDNLAHRTNLINNTVGSMVPVQFGYILEMSDDRGQNWAVLYDTGGSTPEELADAHAKKSRKLAVATQVMTFGYGGKVYKLMNSPYQYDSCRGDGVMGGDSESWGGSGSGGSTVDFGIITCGTTTTIVDNGDGTTTEINQNIGNTPPGDILGGDLVPSSDVRIVKLTIFI
ncbi:hypothetical protein L0Y65_00185 [Candidatus Micrarchaeota archaeon]|nr:hypothetical protein [Candidatus Micrarchaeota archaeon]